MKGMMLELLPEDKKDAAKEIAAYFREGWGNKTRIDYGTGHETCFMAWLFCLMKLGLITPEDYQATVSRVFAT